MFDRPCTAAPGEPHGLLPGRDHGVSHRAAGPGIDRQRLRIREVAQVEAEDVQPGFRRTVTLCGGGVPGHRGHRHGAGAVGQQRQFVARSLGDQTPEGHRGQQAGCFGGFGAGPERARRGDGFDGSARRRCFDVDRDRPARRGVKSRAARRRDELHAAAQIGCDVESGLRHRREPRGAVQRV